MKNRDFILLSCIFLFCLILISNVSSIGITPGRTSIDFEPNLERTISFSVLNTENKDFDIAFSVEGDLAEYISISSDVASLSREESSKEFTYSLKLPNGLSPGLHKANVIALEVPEEGEEGEVVVRATVSVATQVYVYVPYPGKYIESRIDVVNNQKDGNVIFYIPFISRGEEDLESVLAELEIYKGDEKIDSLVTDSLSAKTNDKKELKATWNPKVEGGSYKVVANVRYDDKLQIIEREFNFGIENLDVLGVSVNDFRLGDVAKIKILVQNKLSDDINDAYANLNIYDSDFTKIAGLKSENYEISSNSNKEMVVYWDTEDISKGEYSSELGINYLENLISKNFKMDVSEDSILFTGVGFVVSSGESSKTSVTTILFIVIGLLILINLLWFFYYMRNKSKGKSQEKNPELNSGDSY